MILGLLLWLRYFVADVSHAHLALICTLVRVRYSDKNLASVPQISCRQVYDLDDWKYPPTDP